MVQKAKVILTKNQYLNEFYELLIEKTITKTLAEEKKVTEKEKEKKKEVVKKVFVEYRGRQSEKTEKALKCCQAPCKIIFKL